MKKSSDSLRWKTHVEYTSECLDVQKTTKGLLINLKRQRNWLMADMKLGYLGRRECDDPEQLLPGAFAVLFFGTTSRERRVSQTTVRRDHQCGRLEWLCSKPRRKRAG